MAVISLIPLPRIFPITRMTRITRMTLVTPRARVPPRIGKGGRRGEPWITPMGPMTRITLSPGMDPVPRMGGRVRDIPPRPRPRLTGAVHGLELAVGFGTPTWFTRSATPRGLA